MAARVFLDTSALFAGIWSNSGGARLVLQLGEAGAIHLLVSPQVLLEAERALRRKAPEALPDFALLIERTGLQVVATASADEAKRFHDLIEHAGDAQVMADAAGAKPHFFVTLDKEHFLANRRLSSAVQFPLGTPGDFIGWFRQHVSPC